MEMNKYLEELGITWYDLPGNYISKMSFKARLKRRLYKIKRGFCFAFAPFEDKAPAYDDALEGAAFDIRNKIDKSGFCEYEFFSLDYTFALYIYPRLCKFRDEYAKYGTPCCLCYNEDGNHIENGSERWIEILNKMIYPFKEVLKESDIDYSDKDAVEEYNNKIKEGMDLFAEYFRCLWW